MLKSNNLNTSRRRKLMAHIDIMPLLDEENVSFKVRNTLSNAAGYFTEAINISMLEKKSSEPNPSKMSLKQIIDYAEAIGGRWSAGERELIERRDPRYLINYASIIIESHSHNKSGRWKTAEPIIIKTPQSALAYVMTILKEEWEFGESIIGSDPETAALYAIKILGKRWTARKNGAIVDHQIISRAKKDIQDQKTTSCSSYAKIFFSNMAQVNNELTTFLLEGQSDQDEKNWRHYYETSDLSRLSSKQIDDLVDSKIIKPTELVIFAREKGYKSWPEAENAISRHSEASYVYANQILKAPWPIGEPAILRVDYLASEYARNVLKRPWPAAEHIIQSSVHEAMNYARHFGKLWDDPVTNILIISKYPYFLTSFEKMTSDEIREKVIYDFDIETALNNIPIINMFCTDVLGHRWLEIEDILKAVDPSRYKMYIRDIGPLGVG
jgi:hypothetical protein